MTSDAMMLAVDDQPQNLRLLDAVLSPRGYRVVTAESGEDALAVPRDEPVDLVLLDILMPGMDGYEVCRRIRADAATAFLPVVMITASGEQQRVTRPRGGRGRLRHQAVRPERAACAGGVAGADQALSRHNPSGRPRSLPPGTPSSRTGSQAQVEELERDQPAAAFPVAAAGRPRDGQTTSLPDEPPARDRRGVLRLEELHTVRGDQRAGGGDGRARASTTERIGALDPRLRRHPRAVHG